MKKLLLSLIFSSLFFVLSSQAQNYKLEADSLYAQYPFNGNAVDESPSTHDGVAYGATLTNDRNNKPNSAYSFSGANYIEFPTVFQNDAPDSFTISWWLYTTENKYANNQLAGKTSWGGFVFHSEVGGSVYVGTDVINRFTPADLPIGTVSLNVWQHFVFRFDNGNGTFFKNGIQLASKSGMRKSAVWGGLHLGAPNSLYSVVGSADDLTIWNRALNSNEIAIITSLKFNESLNSNVSVHPNPTTDKLYFDSKQVGSYSIINVLGTEIEKGNINGNYIQVSHLNNGVYHLQLKQEESIYRLKFIKE